MSPEDHEMVDKAISKEKDIPSQLTWTPDALEKEV